jgi:2-keto-4-pentenoate hydratase
MTSIEQNARALIALRHKAGAGAAPPAPQSLQDAYRTQFECERILAAEHGFAPIGWKIGATNAGSRAMFKLEAPFLGRLYRQMTSASPARLPASPKFYRAYEAEIALVLGADLDATKAPVDAAAVRAATRAVAPAIEMVGGYVMPGGENFGFALISDFAGNAYWVLGAEVSDFAALDLEQAPIRFSIDGEEKAVGKGANVDGGPFGATAWLANELGKLGRTLKAGEFITTGTAIAPVPYAGDGKAAVADFGALGRIEVSIG